MTIHTTIPVQVWVDVDNGIADIVKHLQKIPGVRTHASCQGTIGEGGAAPYEPYVEVSWADQPTRDILQVMYHLEIKGLSWGHLRSKGTK